jgi:uncharacterized ferritin-like protein (DUF455 family)
MSAAPLTPHHAAVNAALAAAAKEAAAR